MNIKFKNLKIKDLTIELIDGDRGKNYPKNDEIREKGYCLFLNAKNVTSSGFDFTEKLYITKEKDELLRKGKLKRNDIVLTTRGTVGNVAYFSDKISEENIRINSGMLILRNTSESLNEQYIYWFIRSKIFQNAILMQKTGSAQPQLPISILKEMEIKICDKNYQDKIVKVLNLLQEKIDLNNQTNDNLLYNVD